MQILIQLSWPLESQLANTIILAPHILVEATLTVIVAIGLTLQRCVSLWSKLVIYLARSLAAPLVLATCA